MYKDYKYKYYDAHYIKCISLQAIRVYITGNSDKNLTL